MSIVQSAQARQAAEAQAAAQAAAQASAQAAAASNPAAAPSAVGRALKPALDFWSALPLRERRLLQLAGAVLGLFIAFSLLLQPAWRTVREAPATRDALDQQWQAMQQLAGEARELRALPPLGTAQSTQALRAASERLGDKAKLSLQGERAVLTLNGASSSQLRNWLAEARSGARARAVEMQLTRGPQGYSGTITVALGAGS